MEIGIKDVEKILVWLPVVSLLRFKAVCKSWHDLIQSPFFIHLHTPIILNSSSSSSKFGSFILHVNGYFPSEKDALLMLSSSPSYDDGGSNDDDDQEEEGLVVVVVDDLWFDMKDKEIVGSCNGLVCIRDRQITCHKNEFNKPMNVYIWNPATGQGMDVPESKTIPGDIFSLVVFGFDVETKDDYKVVRFTGLKQRWNGNGSEFCFCRVQLYTLSTNSWRLLEGIPCLPGYPFRYPQSLLYLNGTCFFLAHYFYTKRNPCLDLNDRFIISFDFTKEIITPIQLPDHHRDLELCLCSLGDDKIVLFTSTNPPVDILFPSRNPPDDAQIFSCQDFNIWVLNYERGSSVTKESWKKLYSFQLQLEIPFNWKWYTPSGISNDGKFALLTSHGNKMNLYNFATKEVEEMDFLVCTKVMSKAHAYKLSLVSVIDGNGAGEMVQGAAAAADMVIENSSTNL